MVSWKGALADAAIRANVATRRARFRFGLALGGPGPLEIVAYRGYGTREKLHLKGRVIVDKNLVPAREADTFWKNARNMYKRLNARAIPRARVRVRFQDVDQQLTCDDRGYFETWISPTRPVSDELAWHEVAIDLVWPIGPRAGPAHATAQVLVPPPRARFVVISDLDDTVLQTGATRMLTLLRESFSGNAYTRLPFPGVAAFYRALRAGAGGDEQNPPLYVSRSPWNLYDLLSQFFDIHGIPIGPVLFLREWGLSAEGLSRADVMGLKFTLISRMLDLYRELPFILIGDSGQKDPEIYRALIKRYPGRVLAAYIRNVSRRPERIESIRALAREIANEGSTLILADGSYAMAEHAAASGWIAPDALQAIERERRADEAAATRVPAALHKERVEGARVEVAAGEGTAQTKRAIDEGALERALETGDEAEEETPTVIVRGGDERHSDA